MPHRVLIADDEELERRALRRILSGPGLPELQILEAENGREAIELALEAGLDAAFLDIRMPGIDGIEAARVLRERFPELPLVFLTAYDSFDYARTALRLRVEDFLLKPASEEEVRTALLRALAAASGAHPAPRPLEALLESALGFLGEELRAELGAERVPAEKLERYLRLEGRSGEVRAVAAMRLALHERGQGIAARGGRRKADLDAVAVLFEKAFGSTGMLALAGAGQDRVLGVLAGEPGEAFSEASLHARLEGFAEAARAELGLPVLVGVALRDGPLPSPASAELGASALRVAALASPARPVIVCSLRDGGQPRRAAEPESPGSGRRTALRALELLEARHAEELSLEVVAAEMGVSASHLSRLLGRVAGLGFADCLARFRVERAKYFLSSSSVSVKEVASLVGFRDPAYFARVFRRFEAMSPAEYRAGASPTQTLREEESE
ncbi:MAG TPA: response regulator [Rectinemataceae bacterium]|nr:response regulator [Rectinemataceae bacterium]